MKSYFALLFKHRFSKFLLASLVLHFLILAFITINPFLDYLNQQALNQAPAEDRIEFELTSEPLAPTEPIQAQNTKRLEPMIVDQAEKALNDEIPEDMRFLSQNNQVVQKQTVAENRGLFQNRSQKMKLNPGFDIVKSVKTRGELGEQIEQSVKDNVDLPKEVLDELGDLKSNQASSDQKKNPKNSKGESGASQDEGNADDVSQTIDYIPELETGLETLLTTKEFVFYSYYNRIRTQLHPHWTGFVRTQLARAQERGRSIASISGPQVTKTLVTLNPEGKLLRVQIIGKSTVPELDEAAVLAFRRAAPFPNPPVGMRDPDGNIKLRWDFIVQ